MKKTILCMLLSLSMVAVAACGKAPSSEKADQKTEKTDEKEESWKDVQIGRIAVSYPGAWECQESEEEVYDSSSVMLSGDNMEMTIAVSWINQSSEESIPVDEAFKERLEADMNTGSELALNYTQISGKDFVWSDYVNSAYPDLPLREYYFETGLRTSETYTDLPYEKMCVYIELSGDFAAMQGEIDQILNSLQITFPEGI